MENIWKSPETSSVNRLPMLNLEHPTFLSLDGTWSFQLLNSPDDAVTNNWQSISVPGLWTMVDGEQPFGDKPIYTNTQMPWDHFAPTVPEANPTGIYQRDFTLSDNLAQKRVVLQIGATESVHIVYINGSAVGAGKDSHLASEYDITEFVKTGTNVLTIKVIKWSDATYIEDQDQWWHGGISRSIKLYFTEKVFIERLYATPTLLPDNKTGHLKVWAHINSLDNESFVNYKLQVRISPQKLTAGKGLSKKPVQVEAQVIQKSAPKWIEKTIEESQAGEDFFQSKYWAGMMPKAAKEAWLATEPIIPGPLEIKVKLPVAPWSAETPVLYEVEYLLLDPNGKVVQTATQRVGFRRIEIKGKELLFNGQPIIFYGINRHDFNRRTGRVISKEDYRADLLALKANNFNAVRTSHYPNDPVFLDLCDELGFYVVDEANIESHAFQNQFCDDQKYLSQIVDRVARLVQRDIHHASVVFWSLGNESGAGVNHRAAAAYARSFDPTRPIHYEGAIRGHWTGNFDLTDVVCPMYPSIAAIESYAKSSLAKRPLIMCEYTHAMGNSNGNLKEYWDVIHKYKGLQGGFIWEMWDHGLDQTLPDGTKRSAYGGDYGELKHDSNFVCDGMFFPDRTPKPAMQEFKYLAAPVFITRKGAKFQIFNKFFFIDLSGYKLRYEVTINGDLENFGNLKLPAVKPRKSAFFAIPAKHLKSKEAGERFLTFILEDKYGREVAWEQFALASKKATKPKIVKIVEEGLIGFDLNKLVDANGNLLLPHQEVAPKLTLWRAPTDNDAIGTAAHRWKAWGLRDLEIADSKVVRKGKKAIITKIWQTGSGIKVKHVQTVEVISGTVKVSETITLPKQLHDVARVGINFELAGALDHYQYFGVGPHETVPDRAIGRVGKYKSTVAEQLTDYIKPQENGSRVGVRWFELTNKDGKGLRIDLDKPKVVTVLPVRSTDLADATHNVFVKRCGNTVVTIDTAHRGVGTASCGPDTLDNYKIKPGIYKFSWTISTI